MHFRCTACRAIWAGRLGAAISGMALAWAGWRSAGLAAALVALGCVAALQLARPLLDDDVKKVGAGDTARAGPSASSAPR
jgi:hypothetical protein